MLQWTLTGLYLFKLWFSPGLCPWVGWLDHVVVLFLVFVRNLHTVLHSGLSVYIPTNSVGGLPLLTPSPAFTVCRLRAFFFFNVWLCWVFIAACTGFFSSCCEQGLLCSCGARASHCSGFSCCCAQALEHMGFHSCSFQALEHRRNSCGAWAQLLYARGVFPDQESNPCLLHWQADSLPLSHRGSPIIILYR